MNIRVVGQRVTVAVDDKVITDFTQPDGWVPPAQHPGRLLGSGTFALQGHDPNSEIHYRDNHGPGPALNYREAPRRSLRQACQTTVGM